MNSSSNKKIMQDIFAALSDGNDEPFIDAMADDIKWIWMGSGEWLKTFNGKGEVLDVLWRAVKQTLKPPYKIVANNFIADDDYVCVEAVGRNVTPEGEAYENKYNWVCRFLDGKISELKEYMDTELLTKTFTEKPIKIIDEKFLFDFDSSKARVHFQGETHMQFVILEKEGRPFNETETIELKRTRVRPNLYLATWKEKNNNTISQIQDFQNGIVYSNWTLPDGTFINRQGTITPATGNNVE